jgi:beta-alanine--pyruvate transaminase
MGHGAAFTLAGRLAALAPGDLDRVFFANSGSEAVETALKLSLAYHKLSGASTRTRFIGRDRAYHGCGFGGTSVGGIPANRNLFEPLLDVGRLPSSYLRARPTFSRGEPEGGGDLAGDLSCIVALDGTATIAAVVVEPMMGSAGVFASPKGYLQRLRELTSAHGILLIFDEVISGFGRLGHAFAAERFGVMPDLITCAKGLTNGSVPMGAVIVREGIYDTVVNAAPAGAIEFPHGYTYSGHPLAAAAAIAAIGVFEREGLYARVRELEPYFESAVHELRGKPNVIDIRNLGLVAAVELAPRPGAPGARGQEVFLKCYERNLMVRFTGDSIAVSPPLVIERGEIDTLFETLGKVIADVA